MPVTGEQTEQLRAAMQRRRDELLGEIKLVRSRAGEHPPQNNIGVPDPGDASTAHLLMDVDNAAVERDIQEVRGIEAAFERMADGSYGSCVDCGGDIDYARLSVSPTATRCVPCQERHEKTYDSPSTPSL